MNNPHFPQLLQEKPLLFFTGDTDKFTGTNIRLADPFWFTPAFMTGSVYIKFVAEVSEISPVYRTDVTA